MTQKQHDEEKQRQALNSLQNEVNAAKQDLVHANELLNQIAKIVRPDWFDRGTAPYAKGNIDLLPNSVQDLVGVLQTKRLEAEAREGALRDENDRLWFIVRGTTGDPSVRTPHIIIGPNGPVFDTPFTRRQQ